MPLTPYAAATCFSYAIHAAPTSCHFIHVADPMGIRGGSLGWLWTNPPSTGVRKSSPSTCTLQGDQIYSIFLNFFFPFPIQSISFCPRGDDISAVGKAASWVVQNYVWLLRVSVT